MLDQLIQNPPLGVNGQDVDIDKEFGAQCWDIVELYAELMGVPKEPWAIPLGPLGYAYEAWTVWTPHMDKYFVKIPAGQQVRGDANVYGIHPFGPEGHVNIDLGNGQVFEQNADPDGSPAHIATRATNYLLGSLRFKGANMPTAQDVTTAFRNYGLPAPTPKQIADYTMNPWTTLLDDILKYVQDNFTMSTAAVDFGFKLGFDRPATADEIAFWTDKNPSEFLQDIYNTRTTGSNASTAIILQPNTLYKTK